MVLGVVVVLGACVALWWHHQQYKRVDASEGPDHALVFAQRQYNRRSITTTMIGVLGLLILATEISRSVWLNIFIMLAMASLLMLIPLMALIDFQATRRYYRQHDQGVRRATKDLLEELQRIEKKLHEKRQAEQQAATHGCEAGEERESSKPPGE
jgi:ABC-type multidrug transport system fused ATPase/permease subunit